jgi:hypothetical protein
MKLILAGQDSFDIIAGWYKSLCVRRKYDFNPRYYIRGVRIWPAPIPPNETWILDDDKTFRIITDIKALSELDDCLR